jgi:primosomal protein N' (replication factor Y)
MAKQQTNSLFVHGEDKPEAGGHIIRVAFEAGVDSSFDYIVPDKLWPIKPGQRVEAPFGASNRHKIGFCVAAGISPEESFISRGRGRVFKAISAVTDEQPLLDGQLLALGEWMSRYYVCPLGQVLAAMVPGAVKSKVGARSEQYVYLVDGGERAKPPWQGLTARRQKQIVTLLAQWGAFGPDSAARVEELLAEAGCTAGPLKELAKKQIVRFARRTVLRSLPVVPAGMVLKTEKVVLNPEQQQALARIMGGIDSGRFGVTLLYGVTDSGKTELYIHAISEVVARGKTAIVLLPEIALTTQTVQRFSERFAKIAVLHSQLPASTRHAQWRKIKSGEANVVIGARSAVFAPVAKLGLIVVDEEHEPSYKQDTAPRYNARDVAIRRAQLASAHCILGSATPSLESMLNCRRRKYFQLVCLRRRVMDVPMPQMELVDLSKAGPGLNGMAMISEPLETQLREVLARGEQAILLLNRRGYSNFIFCPGCRSSLRCRNCDVAVVFHTKKPGGTQADGFHLETVAGPHLAGGYAVCHYCLAQMLVPQRCLLCGSKFVLLGFGSQRLERELAEKFPQARVARVDSDSMQFSDYYRVLGQFGQGRIDILAGTQILAKGLHFPNVTLVGVISADTALAIPDFRANERTFQLICQVAGRAGRSRKQGVVFVQTFLPQQPAIRYALQHDYEGFVKVELRCRQECKLPPLWRLALITMRDRRFDKLMAAAEAMRARLAGLIAQEKLPVELRGPIPAAIARIQRFHRVQIIIQAPQAQMLQRLFDGLRVLGPVRPQVKTAIDVDPVNLL